MYFSYYRRPVFLLLLCYAAAIFVFRDFFLKPRAELPFPLPRSGALVEGRVAEYPISRPGGRRFTLDTTRLYGQPFKTSLMVYAKGKAGYSYGDKVSLLADLDRPAGASAPGSLDWADYLGKRGVTAEARALQLDVEEQAGPVLRLARAFRLNTLETFDANLSTEAASVLGGVVIGEKRGVPPDLKLAFQDSGAMHLLVASGSNVGFVVAVVYFFLSRLGIRRRWSGLAALALAGFYVTASGLDPPLVRAYLMFSAGLCAFLLRRESGAFQALVLAALAILAVSPRALFDAGFQMSFLAAYGLIVGMALWGRYFALGGLAGQAVSLLRMSFFAQLGLYPLLAFYFHKLSLVSLFSNMLLVPASAVAMSLGFLLAFCAKAAFLMKLLVPVTALFMKLFIGAVRFFAGLPFSSVYVAEPSPLWTAGFYLAAFALLHAPLIGFRAPRLYLAGALGLAVMAAGTPRRVPAEAGGRGLALLFGDTDTSCALVKVPGTGLFIVNPGLKGKKLADAVFAGGGRSVEGIMLTSLEKKNFSGLEELAGMIAIKSVLVPYGPQPPALGALLEKLRRKGIRVRRVWPGEEPAQAGIGARWGGGAGGYTGRNDVLDWHICGLSVEKDGAYAVRRSSAGPLAAETEKGAVTSLEFDPAGRGAPGQAKLVSYPL